MIYYPTPHTYEIGGAYAKTIKFAGWLNPGDTSWEASSWTTALSIIAPGETTATATLPTGFTFTAATTSSDATLVISTSDYSLGGTYTLVQSLASLAYGTQ